MTAIVFFLELIVLFFLSRVLTREISRVVDVRIMSFLFLPGIIIHELSHILVASVMFVPVGEIEFLPKISGNTVRLGSAAIGKTDPIRRAIIGLAPILLGLFILFGATTLSVPTILLLYIVFEVGNTMFSSTRDLEGFIETLITGGVLGGIFYAFSVIAGINIPQIALPAVDIGDLLSPLIMTFGIAILIDLVIIITIRIFTRQ